MKLLSPVLCCVLSVSACRSEEKPVTPPAATPASAPTPPKVAPRFDALSRDDFNLRAQERFVPLFWRADLNADKNLDPNELAVLWGPWSLTHDELVGSTGFTPKFGELYAQVLANEDVSGDARKTALKAELAQGKPTLLEADTSSLSPAERLMLKELGEAALVVERLYAREHATEELAAKIPAQDTLSKAVFHRNQSPFCVAPKTEKDPACVALDPAPSRDVGLYPAAIQKDPKFCALLEKQKNKAALMDHFSTVVADGAGFKSVPFSEAWKADMEAVAVHLDAANAALSTDSEAALKQYLTAAAKAFRTNDWEGANEAWVAMNATNSRWYLRVAPDEVYHEPCAWKGGFALQLARINPDSLEWKQKLDPVKQQMEQRLAMLAGAPYKARDVQFKLPDFIDVVINSGDQRNPHGATAGQSLPNWGPVSEKGGRTVVMTNLSSDVDSRAALGQQMSSVFCKQTFGMGTTDPKGALMSVVLHEAAHNFGPAHDYLVKGKKDSELFGGPLASMMEELKAQTSALYLVWWLVDAKRVTEDEAIASTVRDIAWAFSHASRGMYDGGGAPRTYSQLASIQLGTAVKSGALNWKPEELAANGTDTGCFELNLVKWRNTVDELEKQVLVAKAKGDRKTAEKLKAEFVDAPGEWAKLRGVFTERYLRVPKATFVYSF